jgi:acetyltransferase-like isoleucine patch superfamily enzyme
MSLFSELKDLLREYHERTLIKKRFPGTHIEQFVIIKGNPDNLLLGKKVVIQSGTVLHLGGLDWCDNKGSVEIGDDSVISPNCVIYGCGPGGVRIGKNFDCGSGVGIFSCRSDYNAGVHKHIFAPAIIGDSVIIYANAVVSPGVTIGDRAVIFAGSVVTHDIPADCIAGGSPAKVIRKR